MSMGSGLLGIIKEAKENARNDAAKPLLDCPVCGNALKENSRGEKSCDVGHFKTGGGASR